MDISLLSTLTELRTWIKIPLFLSSYLPLWLIFLFSLFLSDNFKYLNLLSNHQFFTIVEDYALIAFSLLIAIPFIILIVILYITKNGNNPSYLVIDIRPSNIILLSSS